MTLTEQLKGRAVHNGVGCFLCSKILAGIEGGTGVGDETPPLWDRPIFPASGKWSHIFLERFFVDFSQAKRITFVE